MSFLKLTVLILLFICGCSFPQKKNPSEKGSSGEKILPFFEFVSFTKLSSINVPCMELTIEDKTFSVELDLGYRGAIALRNNSVDQIKSKELLLTKPMYGIRGKEYQTSLYRIPKANLGAVACIEPILQEEPAELSKDAVFAKGRAPSPREPGALGWELFHSACLLVDVKHSRIAVCDSLETLKKNGYVTESFIKTPLLLERGLVEFKAEIPDGTLRCMLDTGSTCNVLNRELEEGKTLEQIVWDPSNILECPSLKISNQEFGPLFFRQIPIKIPVHVEAILGMEFFEDHLIFLDFAEKYAYFAKDIDEETDCKIRL